MDTMTIHAGGALDAALRSIAAGMDTAGDSAVAAKIGELRAKLAEDKVVLAFCGHFSAGKSTLVNRLCGTPLLPSSPIPTSANVVSIRNGEPAAVITRVNGGREETVALSPGELEAYCVNGSDIVSVDLSYPIPRLGGKLMLLDTPGIDSTDDAHRMATESALHLADVVFYVMDYNHVQSEINFAFAKRLADWGKPLVLVVNQIDKHRANELPFAEYRASVERAFGDWHLEPDGLLFLSMKQPDHPHQQWEALERLLERLPAIREPLNAYNADASARYLIEEHGKRLEEASEAERAELLRRIGGEERLEAAREEIGALRTAIAVTDEEPERLRVELRRDVQALLDNAIVTPASTRDLAHSMLESRKPGFKTGLLFAGAKTAAEQERRLDALQADINAQLKANVEWHLKDLLRKAAERNGWRGETMENAVASPLEHELTAERLLGLIKPGAVFGAEYAMTYSKELAAAAKADYRRLAFLVIDGLAERLAARMKDEASAAAERLSQLAGEAEALDRLEELAGETAAAVRRLTALLPARPRRPVMPRPADTAQDAANAETGRAAAHGGDAGGSVGPGGSAAAAAAAVSASAGIGAAAGKSQAPASSLSGGAALAPQRVAGGQLRRASSLLAPYAPLAQSARTMRAKADRLEGGRFTIALFGAFSAGKSSFANALIGMPALPVSPNPTTAAINRIVPPSADYPHGTARIVMKRPEALLDDVRHSLELLGEEAAAKGGDIGRMLETVRGLKPGDLHPGGRPHYSFLKAALSGWDTYGSMLGAELRADEAEYRRFVAEESRSCFVQEIELHVDCPLTAQGIVLVDTPGADSVNARHTEVAFHYIKNADAILFVTYYNHAFSQADRQFLLQLGRVKDQFELDKMFFVVNAADLAADAAELEDVTAHVERNLLQHGIRFPRLFPVSSLQALDAKREADPELLAASGFEQFESAFLAFTQEELGGMAAEAAGREIARALGIVEGWLDASGQDAATRRRRIAELHGQTESALALASGSVDAASFEPLRQELRELFHHVLQRIRYRFGEHFNYALNPSSLQDDGRDLRKMLWMSWLELQRLLRQELEQELQATSLRLGNALRRMAVRHYEAAAASIGAELDGFAPAAFEPEAPEAPAAAEEWRTDAVELKWLWARFKSPRQFFEGEGKTALRGELDGLLAPAMKSWMEAAAERWERHYLQAWEAALRQAADLLIREAGDFAAGREASLEEAIGADELRKLKAGLAELI